MKPDILKYLPCNEGLAFYEGKASFKEAWESCPRGDWMLWFAKKLEIDIRILTLAKAYCAKTVYHLLPNEESRNAIVIAINFGKNLATDKELVDAYIATNAYATDYVSYTPAVRSAAATVRGVALSIVADTTYAATYAADCAAYAADYAAEAYATEAVNIKKKKVKTIDSQKVFTQAKIKNQLKTANICRKYLTKAVFEALNITE